MESVATSSTLSFHKLAELANILPHVLLFQYVTGGKISVKILLTQGDIRLESLITLRRITTVSRKFSHDEFVERFWSRVEKTETCWLWKGPLNNGYGAVRAFNQATNPHRAAWRLLVGPIPPTMQIDHLCRVRNCVNPAHMEIVTGKVNTLRGNSTSARNAVKTHCPQGHIYNRKNTFVCKGGMRHCRVCGRLKAREFRRERRGAYGKRHRPMAERRRNG